MTGRRGNFGEMLGLLLCVLHMAVGSAWASTQIDVGLGENRFFVGERFLITFKDIAYWIAGMCMGLLFGTTFLFVTDFDGALTAARDVVGKGRNSSKVIGEEGVVAEGKRGARFLGSRKYPTRAEERILMALHTEPDNYVQRVERRTRRARKIGGKNRPLSLRMEDQVLPKVENTETNDFHFDDENGDQVETSDDNRLSGGAKLIKSLLSLWDSSETSHDQEQDTQFV